MSLTDARPIRYCRVQGVRLADRRSRAVGSSPAGPALAAVALACHALDVPGGHTE